MFQMNKKSARELKMCTGNKKCAQGTKNAPLSKNEVHEDTIWQSEIFCGTLQYLIAVRGLIWPCMVL